MNKVDEFYPISETMTNGDGVMWQLGMVIKLRDHLANAKAGNRKSESKLCNRLGQLRRCIVSFSDLSPDLQDIIKESVVWLRWYTGRKVDFTREDPGYWITARDGKTPRF